MFGVFLDILLPEQENRVRDLLEDHHPLSAMPTIGETLRSVVQRDGEWLALAVFFAAAAALARPPLARVARFRENSSIRPASESASAGPPAGRKSELPAGCSAAAAATPGARRPGGSFLSSPPKCTAPPTAVRPADRSRSCQETPPEDGAQRSPAQYLPYFLSMPK